MAFFNPFCSQEAISHSNYCTLQQKKYIQAEPVPGKMKAATEQVAAQLKDLVTDMNTPGQEIGLSGRRGNCCFGVYPSIGSTRATAGLCRDLARFLQEYKTGMLPNSPFMAVFITPSQMSEQDFRKKVSHQLQLLLKASEPFYCVPESIEEIVHNNDQLIFFGGKVLKVVSIYRNSSQGQLKFEYPMLAFNVMQDNQ